MDWRIVAALAVPVLGLLGTLVTRDRQPSAYRRMKHASEALGQTPSGTRARATLDALVAIQAQVLLDRETWRRNRKLNWMNVALTTGVTLMGAALGYLCWGWIVATLGTPWVWLSIPVSALTGAVAIIVIVAGATVLYAPDPTKRP